MAKKGLKGFKEDLMKARERERERNRHGGRVGS
jgi:hypothetical protein